ncbi:family 2B encapsulin nanocompartment shell protein [Amycolatopsis taiwanensis]|uniref:family 2B encapsulin nanocompartment shell protein n=1 Tax=Amycolatopsis taiwanensis TaxID=342230 RepID=UPI0004831CEA|nr:family 2B encapsulin nanocompartment shell protein [Amycolatopsis taiwanensis]
MTVTESAPPGIAGDRPWLSLSTAAARNLATTTKTVPQMQGITPRWLLRALPWVEVTGGTYQVNRRLGCASSDGRVSFVGTADRVRVVPPELAELPPLRGFSDETVLKALSERCTQHSYEPGDVLVEFGHQADRAVLIAHGKVAKVGPGRYGSQTTLGILADGDHFGGDALAEPKGIWEYTVKALTPVTTLHLQRRDFDELLAESDSLGEHVARFQARRRPSSNSAGEADITVISGHSGEQVLPGTFADYEPSPREYELSAAQAVLRVHTRVADLYNHPIDQTGQQVRLTVEALREREEHELVNNPEFGLLHNADRRQRLHTRSGPPTPDDFDDLLTTVWKEPDFFLAHPRAIAAFGRECTARGLYPSDVDYHGHRVPAWRGVPILPCDKIGISRTHTTSVLLMRTGETNRGVVGLHRTGLPDEYEPGLSVRFMGIDETATISYLVSAYYSVAVLVPDALGILENVEIGREP